MVPEWNITGLDLEKCGENTYIVVDEDGMKIMRHKTQAKNLGEECWFGLQIEK